MKLEICCDRSWPTVLRRLLVVCVLVALLPVACTAPASSEPAAAGEAPESAAKPEPAAGQIRRGQTLVDSEELIGLGELGLLPALLQSLGTGSECDFDDALSTCQ